MGKLKRELINLKNLLIKNEQKDWELLYNDRSLEFLHSVDQRPRHYTIAGIIAEYIDEGGHILDVGCGYGTLFHLVSRFNINYTGIDFSKYVIRECENTFIKNDNCCFEAVAFENYKSSTLFNVIVLNEFLYYFPLKKINYIIEKAINNLINKKGILIISMNKNPKSFFVWQKIHSLTQVRQSLRVINSTTKSSWCIKVLQHPD